MPPLNQRQLRFVEEYLKDMNATAAVIRAGYSRDTNNAEVQGCRLLRDDRVKALVAEGKAKLAERTAITKEWLVSEITASFRQARGANNYPGVGRLGELLSRLHGYIEDKSRVRVVRTVEDLSDEELSALAQTERESDTTRH